MGLVASLTLGACASNVGPSTNDRAFSEASAEVVALLNTHYKDLEAVYLAEGGLRTETAAPDAPVDDGVLAKTFERVALFTELAFEDGKWVQKEAETTISRWERPIRIHLLGDSLGESDEQAYRQVAQTIGQATGVPISFVETNPNIHIMIATYPVMKGFLALIREGLEDDSFKRLDAAVDQFESPCWGSVGGSADDPTRLTNAIIFVRGETTGRLRQSCIHEELAQVMGLFNDSLTARPSIFNDDQEFALLTDHDVDLLRILYDKDLQPGMTAAEARPLVASIITKLRATQ